jgi:hypothetical protein
MGPSSGVGRIGFVVGLVLGGCADLIGANFDVEPLPATGAAGGSGGSGGEAGSPAGAGGSGGAEGPETLWEGDYPWDIVASGTYVTWSSAGGAGPGGIYRRPKAGGPVERYQLSLPGTDRLIEDGGELYFTVSGPANKFAVGRCFDATVSCEVLVEPDQQPKGLAGEPGYIYYTYGSSTVKRREKSAPFAEVSYTVPVGTSQLLVHGNRLWGTAFKSNQVWWASLPLSDPWVFQVDSAEMTSPNGLAPYNEVVAAGGLSVRGQIAHFGNPTSATLLATDQNQVADLTSRGQFLYWATFGDGKLSRISSMGGGTVQLLLEGEPSANGVAVDETHLYFTRYLPGDSGGAVRRVPLSNF